MNTSRAVLVRLLGGVGLMVALALPAATAAAGEAETAEEVLQYFVVPRTEALARAAALQAEAWPAFCAAPSQAWAAEVRRRFAEVVEAWAAVEVVRFGPVAEASRHERLNFHPERRNATGRAVAGLLAGAERAMPDRGTVAQASVAGQGLGALERILHDPEAAGMAEGTPAGRRRCAVGAAIAAAVAATARETAEGWGHGDPSTRLGPREVLVRSLTDLVTFYRGLVEVRIKPVVGDAPGAGDHRAAAFWRAGLADRTTAVNLAAGEALASILASGHLEAEAALRHAAAAREVADGLEAPLAELAADPARRHRALMLFAAVRDAHNRLLEVLPEALGVTVGFNSLDGD
ncbi:imelysin family protein [Prosthecomicrobium sp. N25]|uniref:imelysin family protein n=1 Tax=Prosthecomicrobium sp. N25 TaxID=3129254 RepID=UPI003076DF08